MRIIFPLKIITYPKNKYDERGMDDPLEKITSAETVAYEDAIFAAIAKDNRYFENGRGLAEYIYEDVYARRA